MLGMKKKKTTAVPTAAPVEEVVQQAVPIVPQEVAQQVVEVASETLPEQPADTPEKPIEAPQTKMVPYPLYLSQDKINEMTIENNLMLKEILVIARED